MTFKRLVCNKLCKQYICCKLCRNIFTFKVHHNKLTFHVKVRHFKSMIHVQKFAITNICFMYVPAITRSIAGVYHAADEAFHDIVDVRQPIRTVAELDCKFAHEAPVYLAGLDKVGVKS